MAAQGSDLDAHAKQWRLFADVFNNVGAPPAALTGRAGPHVSEPGSLTSACEHSGQAFLCEPAGKQGCHCVCGLSSARSVSYQLMLCSCPVMS